MDLVISDLTDAQDYEKVLLETTLFKSVNNEDVIYFIDKNSYNFQLKNILKNYEEIKPRNSLIPSLRCFA